jgi:cytochrome b
MPQDGGSGGVTPPVERRIWDPLLRIFHWALVAAFATSFVLGEFGPNIMTLHFWSGYVICGLLAFRLIWGIFGSKHARFTDFIAGPGQVVRYMRHLPERSPSYWPGHNPLGGLAVIALLLLLVAQVTTGLLADPEDYINQGPLAHLVSADMNRAASAWHEIIGSVLLGLIALHVGVIVFYRIWKREDLIRPMITGRKKVRPRD